MLKIYLARHGQNVDNANGILNGHRDLPLTDIGVDQATEAALKIATLKLHFDRIYTSPLIRAQQTAKIISDEIKGPTPVIMPGLIERDFGDMSGVSQTRIRELCAPDIIDTGKMAYFLNPVNGETFPQVLQRAHSVLDRLKRDYTAGNILLVGHMDCSYMLYAAYYNLDWKEVLKTFFFGNSELILLSPDSPPESTHVFNIEQFNT